MSRPGEDEDGADERDAGTDEPAPVPSARPDDSRGPVGWLRWAWTTDRTAVVYVREALSSVGIVVLVGLVLFGVSGLWPPMVAVESTSMYPNMKVGDLVFVMEEHRLAPEHAYAETGVVTYRRGQDAGYTKFRLPGDVIVFRPDGRTSVTPIIHRAMFYVNESENWYDRARAVDPSAVGNAENCRQLVNCPAPHAGFITKGDNNGRYDQVSGLSGPVRPAWVVGTAEFRIPWLGNIRLWVTRVATDRPAAGTTAATPSPAVESCCRTSLSEAIRHPGVSNPGTDVRPTVAA